MVDYKSKYFEMKLKYLNSKKLIGGNNHNSNYIYYPEHFFTFESPENFFEIEQFIRLVKRDFLNFKIGFNSNNSPNQTRLQSSFYKIFKLLKKSLQDSKEENLHGIVDTLRNDPNLAYDLDNNLTSILKLYGAELRHR